ncbi:hypothetical protein DYI37_12455 [Fulvimarina endophytica]|uniref:Uncharacterized protein n=1 Tax=Fulvimarina endophytica TaxID=2293836 RepID=A0A371X0L5_9HYPH|nr:hypothetical protein [Fulvimarina endophytica]RFC62777.1 hypothetical protein DYI37_12455 [Fulvimarina endophytica]
MKICARALAIALSAGFALPLSAMAQDGSRDYFERYAGPWTGGGQVRVQQLPAPVDVSCDLDGVVESDTEFSLAGNCSAFLVMSNDIGAQITLDEATGDYTGVYTGSKSGPAKLAGSREGDALDLTVTWNKKIYDDDTAKMRIANTGDGTFQMTVVEKIDGEDVTVSDLTFEKKAGK